MTNTERLPSTNINSPNHRAEPGELMMGLVSAVVAFGLAWLITQPGPERR